MEVNSVVKVEMLAPALTDGTATFTASGENRNGTKTTFNSALKNTDLQTNSAGTVTAERQYDAFGNVIAPSGAWTSQFGNAGRFGYQEDHDSGLKLLGHRYYDSSTGRFLTRDKIKFDANWYAYCGNNPVTYHDAEGERARLISLLFFLMANLHMNHFQDTDLEAPRPFTSPSKSAPNRTGGAGSSGGGSGSSGSGGRGGAGRGGRSPGLKPWLPGPEPTPMCRVSPRAMAMSAINGGRTPYLPQGKLPVPRLPSPPRASGGGLGVFFMAPAAMAAAGSGMASAINRRKTIQAGVDELYPDEEWEPNPLTSGGMDGVPSASF